MAAKGRFSIALMMLLVTFIAVDIALVQSALVDTHSTLGRSAGYMAIVLPMANLLLLFLPRLSRDHLARSFWLGFEGVGWGVILILGYMDEHAKSILFIPYHWYRSFDFFPPESASDVAIVFPFFVFVHTPPQLLLAFLGGRFAAWLPGDKRIRVRHGSGKTELVEMSTKKPVWSVGTLMKFSMYAAVNFAVFHAVGRVGTYFVVCLLTVLNLLFFWFSRWNRDRTDRKFWDWFELIGMAMIGLSVTFADWSSNLIIAPINWLVNHEWIRQDGPVNAILHILGATIVYGLPPLAVATLAGWTASRYGASIGRIPTWAQDELSGESNAQDLPEAHSPFDDNTWPAPEP
jgi:hypothetical protein